MTDREAFEKWCADRSVPFAKACDWYFEIWQAATAAATAQCASLGWRTAESDRQIAAAEREHCLAICNRNSLEWERQGSDVRAFAADQIAAAIRGQD